MIRSANFSAVSTDETGRKGKSDADQLRYAVSENCAIVTHNRIHFEKLAQTYFAKNQNRFGIIISVQRPPREIADALLKIVNKFTGDEMKDQVIYI